MYYQYALCYEYGPNVGVSNFHVGRVFDGPELTHVCKQLEKHGFESNEFLMFFESNDEENVQINLDSEYWVGDKALDLLKKLGMSGLDFETYTRIHSTIEVMSAVSPGIYPEYNQKIALKILSLFGGRYDNLRKLGHLAFIAWLDRAKL